MKIWKKTRVGQIPSTSVVNLIFVLSNHVAPLAKIHFNASLNFLDIFLPGNLSSMDRAQVFLWLMFHYLESPAAQNPFHDEHSRNNPGKVPVIRRLSDAEMEMENVDTPEEVEWGNKMSNLRNEFLHKLVSSTNIDRRPRNALLPPLLSQVVVPEPRPQRQGHEAQWDETSFLHYVPPLRETAAPVRNATRALAQVYDSYSSGPQRQERTMLQHAWQSVMTSDPLADSDEEILDEHVRLDCSRRLDIINRLRGRSPTPELVTAEAGGRPQQ